jgi:hypothetical protein
MKKGIFIAVLLFCITSCKQKTIFIKKEVPNGYSILVPDYLQPCADLHKDASLQYQNVEEDIYALVIDEKKVTMQDNGLYFTLDEYYKNIVSQPFLETIKDVKVTIPGRQQINGKPALITEMTGKVDKNEVFYKMGLIETPYEFYQILIWTRGDNKEKFEPDMMKMIESFNELPHPAEELPIPKLSDSVSIVPAYKK